MREGQKGRLGELRVAEDTKRRSGAPPGGSGGWVKTAAPEGELEDEVAALPPASSSSAASPLRPPEKMKPRQEELAGPERRPRWSSPRAGVVTASGAKLEDEAAALPPAPFLFRSLPTPAAQGDDPGEFTAPATRMMGAAG